MSSPVLVEGSVFSQPQQGGIWRTYIEVIPRIIELYPDLSFLVHLPVARPHPIQESKRIKYWQEPRPGTWNWRKRLKKQHARMKGSYVFHATYYEPAPWQGMATVSTVYDFIDARIPLLVTNGPNFIERQYKSLLGAQLVIALSEATKADAVHFTGIDPDKVLVVPLAANELFSRRVPSHNNADFKRYTRGRKYWLYVGSRAIYKNFEMLLSAFAQVAKKCEEDLLVIGGEQGLAHRHQEFLIRKRLEHRVHYLPRLSDQELGGAYAAASAFVYPSLAEGFGIPVLEAMASGTPTVLSDIPVFREVSGGAAMFFDPHDVEALANSLLTVSDQSKALSLAGLENVKRFDWTKTARGFAQAYQSLL